MLHRSRHIAGERLSQTTLLLSVAVLFVVSACRDKDNTIVGPGPSPGNGWSLDLENTPVLYAPPNDTINVHLTDPEGNPAIGKTLTFRAEFDSNLVTHNAQTTSSSWGCNPPLVYWGNGSDDQDNPVEIIYAYYIDPTTHDTLAQALRSYAVRPP
jgi:hypothetical protein